MDSPDAQTIQAILDGAVDRYAELVDKYQAAALKLAFSMLGNYEDARDASQEAFLNAYRSLARFRYGARFSTWLYRIVVNECKDVYKRRSREPRGSVRVGEPDADESGETLFVDVADPTGDPRRQAADRELGRSLSRAIGSLPMKQRTAFALHHLHGLSLEGVADVMRCRVGTVKSHVFRATERLRIDLAPSLAQQEGRSWT